MNALITIEALYRTDPVAACKKALKKTAKLPWKHRLDAINKLLGTHGIESIHGEWQNGWWCNIVASYCNTGDTYAVTVLHQRGDDWNPAGKFIVTSWGDWVEKNNDRFGIQ